MCSLFLLLVVHSVQRCFTMFLRVNKIKKIVRYFLSFSLYLVSPTALTTKYLEVLEVVKGGYFVLQKY